MSKNKLDPNIDNNNIGLYITRSGLITLDQTFPEPATFIKCTGAGIVAYQNELTGNSGILPFEAGEMIQIACTKITTAGTTATGLYWATTGSYPFMKARQ
jgi:hypothetical protein